MKIHRFMALIGGIAWAVLNLPASAQPTAESVPLSQVVHIHGLAVDLADPSRLFLAIHYGLFLVSPDGTAKRISKSADDFMGFTPHPNDPTVFYASGHPSAGGNLGFITSTDGGVTWKQLSKGARGPVDFHQMDVSKADPSVIYGVYSGVVQVSRDAGTTWQMVGPAPDGMIALAAGAKSADAVYAATNTRLEVSRDGGKTWQPAYLLKRPFRWCISLLTARFSLT